MKQSLKTLLILCLCLIMVCAALPIAVAAEPEGESHASDLLEPLNPNASQESKNLLAYLTTVSQGNQFISGTFDMATSSFVYDNIGKQFGAQPGLYSCRYATATYDGYYNNDFGGERHKALEIYNQKAANENLKKHYDAGNVLLVHADSEEHATILDMAKKKGIGTFENEYIDHLDATNPDRDQDIYAAYDFYVNNVIAALKELEDMGVKAYMFRFWVEFAFRGMYNETPTGFATFQKVYKQTVERYCKSGLTGFLITWSPTGTTSMDHVFPGNEYVDVMGATIYSSKEDGGSLRSENFLCYDFYVNTGKPILLAELGCRTGDSTRAAGDGRGSWYKTLQSVVEMFPRVAAVNCWGDGSYSLLNDTYGSTNQGNDDGYSFMQSPYTLNLPDLVDYRTGVYAHPGVAQVYGGTNYSGARVALEEKVYSSAELKALGLDPANVRSYKVSVGYAIRFYAGDNGTGESWGYITSCKDTSVLRMSGKAKSLEVTKTELISRDKDVWASGNDGDAWKVNDGNRSRWMDDTPGDGWLMIDLDGLFVINRWIVRHAGYVGDMTHYNTSDFCLQSSMDGETWTTVDTVTNNQMNATDRNVDDFAARYVRVYITKANTCPYDNEKDSKSICEVEIYGMQLAEQALPEGTGLFKVDGEWLYIEDGEWMSDYCGFVKHDESNTWFYVTDGKIDWNLNGAFKHPSGIWFVVKGGQIDWGYNGFYKANGVWFYFTNGQIVWETTGLFKHPSGQWFYVKNAQIDWGYTGFGKHLASNTWFYCENGTIAWSKSGAFKHPSGIWFMVNGGQIDWKYNGFYKVSGIWFYFENGQINWNLTGLYKLPSANAWFYVKNAQIDWNYNGKATKNGVTFNVRNGQVIF